MIWLWKHVVDYIIIVYGIDHGPISYLMNRDNVYYVACAEEVAQHMNGADQERWLARLASDLDNIQAALQGLLERGEAEEAQRLCAAIWLFMRGRANHRDGRHLLQAALALPKVPRGLRVQVLIGAGWLAIEQGDSEQGSSYFEEILAVADELEDQRVVADAYRGLGRVAMEHGQAAKAEQYFQRSLTLTRVVGDEVGAGWSLGLLGVLALNRGDAREAMARQAAAVARFRPLQHLVGMAACLSDLGSAALAAGDRAAAIAATREGLVLAQQLGSHEIVVRYLMNMALIVASQEGELTTDREHVERAARLWGAIAAVRERNDLPPAFRGTDAPSIARICVQVDRETWARAWAEGRAMTLEQAIAYALEATGPQ
jgi:tetratricopeptide (TPR) repeat protein